MRSYRKKNVSEKKISREIWNLIFLNRKHPEGNRWIKCEFCGKIDRESNFTSYGDTGHINLGTCKDCSDNNPAVKEKTVQEIVIQRRKYDPTICPDCGGKLRERSGPYGRFYGCTNYPQCRYSMPQKIDEIY